MVEDRSRRVLVVEDDRDQREVYCALLYYNGFEVDGAGSMLEAVEHIRTQKPDAILLDVILPDANGIEAAFALRSAEATARIPIVCMTAYDIQPERAIAAGCHSLLRKPVNGVDLVRALTHTLSDREPQ